MAAVCLLIDAYCNGIKKIQVFGDSQVVIRQITGIYVVKSDKLQYFYNHIKKLRELFD